MASQINQNNFLKPLRFLLLLALTLGTHFLVTECAAHQTQVQAEVGGNVTFYCAQRTTRPIRMMYLQRVGKFINGFYSSRNISQETWPNTRVDRQAAAVHMYNLNVSHEGDYECPLQFDDNKAFITTEISLRLTACYSKPSISIRCDAENRSCLVVCTSHSGYPSAEPTWNVTKSNSSQWWGIVDSNETRSQDTLLFNTSSTAVFNCSGGEQKFSCSVGGSTSEPLSVCAAEVERDFTPIVIAAVVVLVVVLAILVTLCHNCKKRSQLSRLPQDESRNIEELRTLNVTSPAS